MGFGGLVGVIVIVKLENLVVKVSETMSSK